MHLFRCSLLVLIALAATVTARCSEEAMLAFIDVHLATDGGRGRGFFTREINGSKTPDLLFVCHDYAPARTRRTPGVYLFSITQRTLSETNLTPQEFVALYRQKYAGDDGQLSILTRWHIIQFQERSDGSYEFFNGSYDCNNRHGIITRDQKTGQLTAASELFINCCL